MKLNLLNIIQSLLLSGSVWVLLANDVKAQETKLQGRDIQQSISPLQKLESQELESQKLVQSLQPNSQSIPNVVEVTGVKLNQTDKGIEVILETNAAQGLQVSNQNKDKNLIADIVGAQLRLSTGNTFSQENPIQGITSVTLTNQDAKTIRLIVVGEVNIPQVKLFDSKEGLIFALTPAVSSAEAQPKPETDKPRAQQPQPEKPKPGSDEPIELTVTGEQDGYLVPNSTTGTRTDTPLRDVPQSVQVIPREVLRDQQVTRLDEALRNSSGVVGNTTEGESFRFSIRGFERANILRDGFNVSASDSLARSGISALTETANLEQIEILKGPASILYGEINPGGIINAVTKKPLSTPLYEVELQGGSRSFFRPRIDFSGPLTSDGKLLYRLNALYQNDEGFRDFDQNIERQFISPVVTWKISDRTDITFELEYLNDKRPYDTGLLAFGNGIIDIPRDRIVNEPDDSQEQDLLNTGYTLEHRFSENWKLRNAFRYTRFERSGSLTTPIGFDEATGIVTRADSLIESFKENYALQTNIVGNFSTGAIKHNLLFGVDLSRTTADLLTEVNFTPLRLDIFNPVYGVSRNRSQLIAGIDDFTKTEKLGIYLQDLVEISDNFKLLAGLRYDTVKQDQDENPNARNPQGGERSQNPDAFTPRLGVVYQPIPEVSLYASYSRSFTPNTGVTADGDFLKPEEGEGYEIGIKSELVKDRLFATLAYYDITKKNIASPDPNFPVFSNIFVPSGEQRSRGIELDVTGQILPGWNILASYSYIDAEVTEDNNIPVGNRLVGIPKYSASLWTTYRFQKGDLEGLGLGIGFNYVGNRKGDLENSFDLGSYFLTNAAIFYECENWRAALNFKNIFDVDYVQGTPFSRLRNIEAGEPFTVIGSISFRF